MRKLLAYVLVAAIVLVPALSTFDNSGSLSPVTTYETQDDLALTFTDHA
ncbi:MAG: hypothetical protein J5717_11290 [Lachnospiraceae bacterium]|nr:hypothetical protein [Lachnospiraceae bacterium]